jgi:hypothetical protein
MFPKRPSRQDWELWATAAFDHFIRYNSTAEFIMARSSLERVQHCDDVNYRPAAFVVVAPIVEQMPIEKVLLVARVWIVLVAIFVVILVFVGCVAWVDTMKMAEFMAPLRA